MTQRTRDILLLLSETTVPLNSLYVFFEI